MEGAYAQLRAAVEQEMLERLHAVSPVQFEQIVVDFLLGLGYGRELDAGERLGRSGDGGVDGVIFEDALGLDRVYVQAKRWQGAVGPAEVRAFVGSLEGHRASKGVIITASRFTDDAKSYANSIGGRIALIDGETLVALMFDHNLGVSVDRSYEVKRLDSDFFDPE